jgi:hypothetical protein
MATTDLLEYRRENVLSRRIKFTVGADETTPWIAVSPTGGIVSVKPVSGTMRVELTGSPASVVKLDNETASSNALAFVWGAGVQGNVLVSTQQEFAYTTAMRFISVGAGGTAEISE